MISFPSRFPSLPLAPRWAALFAASPVNFRIHRARALAIAAGVGNLGGAGPSAQALTKADNTASLNQAASWQENTAPTITDVLAFDNTITSGSLTISAGALRIDSGNFSANVNVASGRTLTLNSAVSNPGK